MGTYSKGCYVTLPTDDADLSNTFTAGEILAVASIDAVYAGQIYSGQYAVQQYKNTAGASIVGLTWVGKGDVAPTVAPLVLQAYNYSTAAWVDVASNHAAATAATLTLGTTVFTTAQYLSPGGYLTMRVCQTATSATLMDSLTADNTYLIMDTGDYHYLAQTFMGNGNKVTSVKVKLATGGSNTPDGNMWVEIWTMKDFDGSHHYAATAPSYAIPDTYQTCISNTIACSSFTVTPTVTEFTFSGANQFQTVGSTVYCLVVKTSNTQGASPMQLYYNNAGNGPGNISDWTDAGGAWAYLEWYVMHYEVWGTP